MSADQVERHPCPTKAALLPALVEPVIAIARKMAGVELSPVPGAAGPAWRRVIFLDGGKHGARLVLAFDEQLERRLRIELYAGLGLTLGPGEEDEALAELGNCFMGHIDGRLAGLGLDPRTVSCRARGHGHRDDEHEQGPGVCPLRREPLHHQAVRGGEGQGSARSHFRRGSRRPVAGDGHVSRLTRDEVLARVERGESLAGEDLHGIDLTGAGLRGAKLAGADLSYADLSAADLRDADLSAAALCMANIEKTELGGATLAGADLTGAVLDGAAAAGAVFADADFLGTSCRGVHLRQSDLSGANLSGASFRGADLTGARLIGANLHHTDFGNADLAGAFFGRSVALAATPEVVS